jgi:hypothetical protein
MSVEMRVRQKSLSAINREKDPVWKKILVSVLVFVPVAAPIAYAQDPALVFGALDRNSDGMVDQQEAQANELVTEYFADADTDNNGTLSAAEFTAAFGAG